MDASIILINVILLTTLFLPALTLHAQGKSGVTPASLGYAGSESCRECHERFYQLWSTSKHGLAMQPYNAEFAKVKLTPQASDLVIGKLRYRADLTKGVVSETGPKGTKQYKIEHALGGKNVYTPYSL
jgi:hypothetical protein